MIDPKEFSRIATAVQKVRRGQLLVSDRVADLIDELWESVEEFPWGLDEWSQAVTLAPREARIWEERVIEVQYLVGQIEAVQGDHEVIDTGQPVSIEEV